MSFEEQIKNTVDNKCCPFCGKPMKNFVTMHGKFKGVLQKYLWVCDCIDFPKDLVISIG